MRRRMLFALGLASALRSVTAAAETADAGRFDGKWDVTLVCPRSANGATAFTFAFSAEVTHAVLHGENGVVGHPGWMALNGLIQPDGTATLDAKGLTGQSQYDVQHTDGGIPYHHAVTAHFEPSRGAGTWVTPRVCNFTFTRE
jgi:hypothetical protein